MKISVIFFLLTASFCVLRGEDWVVNGKTFHNVQVTDVFPDHVSITYTSDSGAMGVGGPMLKDLSPELQKRFNYDPASAEAAIKQRDDLRNAVTSQHAADIAGDTRFAAWYAELKRKEDVATSGEADLAQKGMRGTDLDSFHAKADKIIDTFKARLKALQDLISDMDKAGIDKQVEQRVIDAVLAENVYVGMPRRAVMLAWGNPNNSNVDINADAKHEQLVFDNGYVYIDNGIVTTIQSR